MKCAVEIGSDVMTYVPNVIKIASGIQKLIGGYPYRHTGTHKHRQQSDPISLLLLFKNKEGRPVICHEC
jgi:hypothetical protein